MYKIMADQKINIPNFKEWLKNEPNIKNLNITFVPSDSLSISNITIDNEKIDDKSVINLKEFYDGLKIGFNGFVINNTNDVNNRKKVYYMVLYLIMTPYIFKILGDSAKNDAEKNDILQLILQAYEAIKPTGNSG
jgi:hypothetical protein